MGNAVRPALAAASMMIAFAWTSFASAQEVTRGEYLARASDCLVCHTMPEGAPYAGGLKMNTPVGVIFTTNITPDPETGIGLYTFEEFDRALRSGVARDGHRLYPAMPYPSFARITREDSRALYDFFQKEVKPVRQKNTPSGIAWPWNARWPLGAWNLIGGGAPYRADTKFDAEWNRGAYLTQGPGHCGACHTPRGWMLQERGLDEKSGAFLAGGELDNWSSPNLRGDLNTGLGRWTQEEIVQYLKTGQSRHGSAFGAMRDVVAYSTRLMTDADLKAIAKYLKSLSPSIERARPVWVYDERTAASLAKADFMSAGAASYALQCASCHGQDGMGGGGLPALAGNPAVLDPNPASLLNIVLNGAPALDIEGVDRGEAMPQFRTFLSNHEIAALVTFIRTAWGNRAPAASEAQTAALRATTTLGGERTLIRHMR